MLGRLDAAFDSQRLFVANASHELRTPLSVIRTELEVTLSDPDADVAELRRMGEVVESAAERAQRLVASLLTLARLQAVGRGRAGGRRAASTSPPSCRPRAGRRRGRGQGRRSSIETETRRQAARRGDPRLLERLIGNLVENAVRHNVTGGWLRLSTGETAGPGLAARVQRRRGHPAGATSTGCSSRSGAAAGRTGDPRGRAGPGDRAADRRGPPRPAAGGGPAVRRPGHPHRAEEAGRR